MPIELLLCMKTICYRLGLALFALTLSATGFSAENQYNPDEGVVTGGIKLTDKTAPDLSGLYAIDGQAMSDACRQSLKGLANINRSGMIKGERPMILLPATCFTSQSGQFNPTRARSEQIAGETRTLARAQNFGGPILIRPSGFTGVRIAPENLGNLGAK